MNRHDQDVDKDLLANLRNEREGRLSSFAFLSKDSRGRIRPEPPCTVRSEFERDTGRIIYCQAFRRLRHKTQVFFNPQNDHICSRIEHVIYVNYIATTIARALNLNMDLVQAISLGHDLGHAPFGHSGETMLDACVKKYDASLFFQHEIQSLRVIDLLEDRTDSDQRGLNLSFEVRDGIVSHCGETYDEKGLAPQRDKIKDALSDMMHPTSRRPATLEGCVVRFADKIAYVGRDIEDAVRAGIMEFEDIPPTIQSTLGTSNTKIVHTLVTDIIHNSLNRDIICMSDEIGRAMEALLKENVEQIYLSDKIKRYEARVSGTIEGIFDALVTAAEDLEKAASSDNIAFLGLAAFIKQYPDPSTSVIRMICDYIAGMTDSYANKCYEAIYWV